MRYFRWMLFDIRKKTTGDFLKTQNVEFIVKNLYHGEHRSFTLSVSVDKGIAFVRENGNRFVM